MEVIKCKNGVLPFTKKLTLFFIASLFVLRLFAFGPTDRLPLDESVIIGTLENGLTYYIRQNAEPNNIATFRLGLNVGSVLEDEDQLGVAHFVEHLAFEGTENFPGTAIRDYTSSIGFGMMGGGLNAGTSTEYTLYMMQCRADDREQLDNAVLILSDWAARITLADEAVEKERGIILEEMRMYRGAAERQIQEIWRVLFEGSPFSDRMPIGTQEVIENVPATRIRDFYNDWYRPDLMAVVVVGDFEDPEEIREMIHKHFNTIPKRENPRPLPAFYIPEHAETKISFNTDPEADSAFFVIWHKHPHEPVETIVEYRYHLIDTLLWTMFSNRFTEISRQQDPPFVNADAYKMRNMSTLDMFNFSAMIDENKILAGIDAIITEIERAKQHGFHASELLRAKNSILNGLERRYMERDNTHSARLAMTYSYHFLDNDPMLSIEDELEITSFLFDTIDLEDIMDALERNITDENRVVTITAPKSDEEHASPLAHINMPSEETILSLFATIRDSQLEPFPETLLDAPLLSNLPKRVKAKKPRHDSNLNLYTWTLKNGATVYLIPTDFRNNEILFQATRTGGHSQAEDDIFNSARVAAAIMAESGLGNFDKNLLDIYLDDKTVSFSTSMSARTESMSGNSSIADFETLMQMIWLTFNEHRFDESAFETWKLRREISARNQQNSPDFVFEEAAENLLFNNHLREKFLSLEDLQQIDHQIAFDFYRNRFDSAHDYNFYFVGNIDKEELHGYVEKYIAPLPQKSIAAVSDSHSARQRKQGVPVDITIIDRGVRFNQTSEKVTVYKGQDDRTEVRLAFASDFDFSVNEQNKISALTRILTFMLNENVREKMSGVYFIFAYPEMDVVPHSQFAIHIYFGCDPHRIDEIIEEVTRQMNIIINDEFEERHLDTFKETFVQTFEPQLRRNNFIVSALTSSKLFGYDVSEEFNLIQMIDKFTREDIVEVAKKYIDFEKQLTVILYPEGFEEE